MNARMQIEMLDRLGDSPTRAGQEQSVFTIRDFDLGIGEPVSFFEQRRQGMRRIDYTVVDQGRFVPLDDWQARFG